MQVITPRVSIIGDKIMVKDLDFVLEKLVKKLANGCSRQASFGDKAILIDSCLDNLATYAMSIFLLYEQDHAKMDSVRTRLFWEGFGKKRNIIWSGGIPCANPKALVG
jgi:hypothetical protein